MTRTSRPDLVRRLKAAWIGQYTKTPYLKSVGVSGIALRSLKSGTLEFDFPVTVLCGPNSTGKTTFLALSVLAFHDENAVTLSNKRKSYYDFSYFFGWSEREKHREGIIVDWKYTNNTGDTVIKGAQRWLRYMKNDGTPRRPERGTEFIGLSRIIPAFEKRGYQTLFKNIKKHSPKSSSNELANHLKYIMSKPYSTVASYESKNSTGSHRLNDYNQTHTSFNAGAGEECLTNILDTLLTAKQGSIVALEEIEIGLHPVIMEHLVDTILEITLKRNLQVLITTHSPDFLRACPKECLISSERVNGHVTFTPKPNIEDAIYKLAGRSSAEVYVVCEDQWAAILVKYSLSRNQRLRIHIEGYGSKNELTTKALAIQKATQKHVLIVWDGDAEISLLNNEELEKNNIVGVKLPGTSCPEQYLINLIADDTLEEKISSNYGLNKTDWENLKQEVTTLSDPHDLFYKLSNSLAANGASIAEAICMMATLVRSEDFDVIRNAVDIFENTHGKKAA